MQKCVASEDASERKYQLRSYRKEFKYVYLTLTLYIHI